MKLLQNWVETHLELSLELANYVGMEIIGGMSFFVYNILKILLPSYVE